jgi:hypothetical protein
LKNIKTNGKVISTMRGHINNRYRKINGCKETCTAEKRFTKYLRPGNTGAEVVKVQEFLKDLGFYKYEVDGVYGEKLRLAIRDFQNEN